MSDQLAGVSLHQESSGESRSDKAVALGGAGDSAGLGSAEPAGSVAGYEVVGGVSESGWDYAEKGGQGERQAQQGEHAQDSFGAEADGLTLDEDDGPGACGGESGEAGEGSSGFGLSGGETEDVFAVEAEEEVDPAVAEGAFAVEDYYRVGLRFHFLIVSVVGYGDLLYDSDSEAFQGYDSSGVVGQEADSVEAEVGEDLGAQAYFVLLGRLRDVAIVS